MELRILFLCAVVHWNQSPMQKRPASPFELAILCTLKKYIVKVSCNNVFKYEENYKGLNLQILKLNVIFI